MRAWRGLRRVGSMLALVAAAGAVSGCGSAYMRNRGQDAARILDAGITRTETSQWSFYLCAAGLASVGAGHVDGQYYGLGGGKVEKQRHYEKTLGLLLWSYEELGWGEFDVAKQETLISQYGGLLGWITHLPRRPDYAPGCIHCIHLGHYGFILNLRYFMIADFLAGWFGADLAGDDGRTFGHWPWQDETAQNLPERANVGF